MQNDVISELSIKATLDAKEALGSLNALKGKLLEIEQSLQKLNSVKLGKDIVSKADSASKATSKIAASVQIPDKTLKSVEAVSLKLDELSGKSASVRSAYVAQANAQNALVKAPQAYNVATMLPEEVPAI